MDEPVSVIFFLLACAGVGYAVFLAAREFIGGLKIAKQEYATRLSESDLSSNSSRSEQKDTKANPRDVPREWFNILEVAERASLVEITAAYRRKIALYHPDRLCGLADELRSLAEERAKEINAAYDIARRLRRS